MLGPKRKEGDLQIPEGIYYVNHFNPLSNFFLSLGINYPNSSDKLFADKEHPGGSIYIHGNCVTIGCIPITDDKIKELYVLAVEARSSGQDKIPVHIFPARLDAGQLEKLGRNYPEHLLFWKNLQEIYKDFETTHQLRKVTVDSGGVYRLE
jgi:murein L,D-transpeptidase YafK